MDARSDKQTLLSSDTTDPEVEFVGGQKTAWSSKFTRTIVLSIAFFALGLCIAIPGPTLLDLGERVQTNTEHMSMIFTARSIGYLLGSIIGGFLFDHFDQQILMFFTLILSAIATVAIPWCTALIVLATVISVQGFFMGILSTGGNVFCIQIWKHKSGPYMQGLHFAFAIGAFIAPLLAWPFFSNVLHLNHANNSLISLPQGFTPTIPSIPDFVLFTHPSDSHLVKRDATNPTSAPNISFTIGSFPNTNTSTISASFMTNTVTVRHSETRFIDGSNKSQEFVNGVDLNSSDISTSTITTLTEITHANPGFGNESWSSQQFDDGGYATVSNSTYRSTQTATTVTEMSSRSGVVDGGQLSTTSVDGDNENTSNNDYTLSSTTTATTKPRHANPESVDRLDIASMTTVNQSHLFNLNTTSTPETPNTFEDFVHNTLNEVAHMSKIQFAYAIIGFLLTVNAFMFLVIYCKDKPSSSNKRWTDNDKRHTSIKNKSFRTIMLVLFLFFFAYEGMEVTFGGLLSTFVVGYLNWSESEGATATALFWGSVAAGRGLSIFIAKYFKPHCMLTTNTILVVTGAFILSFGIQMNDIFLWVGTVTIGFGMSSIFPTGISWADHYFPLTGKATAVFVVGSALGEMAIPVFTGYLYENKDKMALMYMMIAVGLSCTIFYVVMQCIASHRETLSPLSTKTRGFVRLDEEDNVSLESLAGSFDSSGYAEQTHMRKGTRLKYVENQQEHDHLIDIDE